MSTVLAVVLLYPVSPSGPTGAAATLGPYFTSGRAFPTLAQTRSERVLPAPSRTRSTHAYVRYISSRYVPVASRNAVIVGINHAQGTPPLPGSITDARHVHAALVGYGFREENITMLLEGQATRPAILGALRSLAERTPASGIAVFAIATHTRRSGGTNALATAEGGRISAHELASHLGAVRGRLWTALPTCYAGGYALPGIVGPNRIATFSSSANDRSYQLGEAGSFLFIHMVRRGMLEGHAPYSVESAFGFARDEIQREHPDQVPSISDGVPEDLVLGPNRTFVTAARYRPSRNRDQYASQREPQYQTYQSDYGSEPSPTPHRRPRRGPARVCGNISYDCPDR
ncbi:MAG TPA: caspase family protein [Actinomycetota bacterium]|nr:caspase family protein [Actinomycetota bacterium]